MQARAMLRLRYPNGALSPPVAAPITLGRGNPPCIADPHCSRAQFQLSPATDDNPARSALRLQAVGAHAVVLERRMQRATAGGDASSAAAAATAAPAGDGGAWELAGFLEKGESASVCAGMRFFVVSRVATTAIEVLPAAASTEGSTGNLTAIATPDGIRRGRSVAGQGVAAGESGVEIGLESRGRAGGESAVSRGEGMDVEEGSGGQKVEEGWTGVGSAAAGTRREAAAEETRAIKRARGVASAAPGATVATAATATLTGVTGATGVGAAATTAKGQQASYSAGTGSASSPVAPGVFDAPFGLLQVRGLPASANRGCLGASLPDLVVHPIKVAVVSNYSIDIAFLLDHCPALLSAKQLVLLHGSRAADPGVTMADINKEFEQFIREAGATGQLTVLRPPTPEYGTHHSKFILLQYEPGVDDQGRPYPGGLRVIIITANFDEGNIHMKTQGLWWQDFPLRSTPSEAAGTAAGASGMTWAGAAGEGAAGAAGSGAGTAGASPGGGTAAGAAGASAGGGTAAERGQGAGPGPGPGSEAAAAGATAAAGGNSAVQRHIYLQNVPPGDFGLDLERYLNALKLQPLALRQQLTRMCQLHDFSSARAHLVMSVPGWHEGSDMHRYGHMGLRSLLKQAQPGSCFGSGLVMQFSSIGLLSEAWLFDEFAASLMSELPAPGAPPGAGPFTSHTGTWPLTSHIGPFASRPTSTVLPSASASHAQPSSSTSRPAAVHGPFTLPAVQQPDATTATAGPFTSPRPGPCPQPGPSPQPMSPWQPTWGVGGGPGRVGRQSVRLVWPTEDQVRNSLQGWVSGSALPGKSSNVSKPFLKPLWSKFSGELVGRRRAMPHFKSFVRHDGERVSWALVGSHNLSQAAWGKLVKGGKALQIRSYELSVLMLPQLHAQWLVHPYRGFLAGPVAVGVREAAEGERRAGGRLRGSWQGQGQAGKGEQGQEGEQQQGLQRGRGVLPRVEFWGIQAYGKLKREQQQGQGLEQGQGQGQQQQQQQQGQQQGPQQRQGQQEGQAQQQMPGQGQQGQQLHGPGCEEAYEQPPPHLMCVPLPYALPPHQYDWDGRGGDGPDVPWVVDAPHHGCDVFGVVMD